MYKFLLAVLVCFNCFISFSQTVSESKITIDGKLNDYLKIDNYEYLAGDFKMAGINLGSLIKYDVLSKSFVEDMPQVNGDIYCLILDEEENIYIGGLFNSVGEYPIKNLAKLTINGIIDTTFKPQPNGKVLNLAIKNDVLICNGKFTEIAGNANNGFASINSKTGIYNKWNLSIDGHVNVMKIAGDTLFFGGKLGKVNGFISQNFGAANIINGNLYPTLSFASHFNEESTITDLIIKGDELEIFGQFAFSGYFSGPFFKYDSNLLPTRSFPQLVGNVHKHHIDPAGNWYLAGYFYVNNNPKYKNFIKMSSTGVIDTSFNFNTDTVVNNFLFYKGDIIVSGGFIDSKTKEIYTLSRLDTASKKRLPIEYKIKGYGLEMYLSGDSLYFYGNNINCFENGTRNFGGLNLNTQQTFSTQTLSSSKCYGKQFGDDLYFTDNDPTKITAGYQIGNAAKFDKKNYLPQIYPAIEYGEVKIVITDKDSNQYLAGNFEQVNGLPIKYLIKVDKTGHLDTNFKPNPDNPVSALILHDDSLFVAGSFNVIGGKNIPQFARIDQNTGVASSWNYVSSKYAGIGIDVYQILVKDTLLIINMNKNCSGCAINPFIDFFHVSKSINYKTIDLAGHMIIDEDTLIFISNFFKYNGINEIRLGGWDLKTMKLARISPQKINTGANKIVLNNEYLYLSTNSGSTYFINNNNYTTLIRLNRKTLIQDTTFNTRIIYGISDFFIDSNQIYFIGNNIQVINGIQNPQSSGSLDKTSGKLLNWKLQSMKNCNQMVFDGSFFYVVGEMGKYGHRKTNGLTKISLKTPKFESGFNEDDNILFNLNGLTFDGNSIIATGNYTNSKDNSQNISNGLMQINASTGRLDYLLLKNSGILISQDKNFYITSYGKYNKTTKTFQKLSFHPYFAGNVYYNNSFYKVGGGNYLKNTDGSYARSGIKSYKSRAMFDSLASSYLNLASSKHFFPKYTEDYYRARADSNVVYQLSNDTKSHIISFLQNPNLNEISKKIKFSDTIFDFEKHDNFLFCFGKSNNKVKPFEANGLLILKNGVTDSFYTINNSLLKMTKLFSQKPDIYFFNTMDSFTSIYKFPVGKNNSEKTLMKNSYKGISSSLVFEKDILYYNINWFKNKKETGKLGAYNYNFSKDLGIAYHITNGHLNGLYVSKGNIIHVGNFTKVDTIACQNIFQKDKITGMIKPWKIKMNGRINTSFLFGGTMYIAGLFDSINGEYRNNIAALDEVTGNLKSWNPEIDGEVKKIIVLGDKLFMHGNFLNVGGKKSKYFGVLNTLNGEAANFKLDLNDSVENFFINNSELNIFGKFTKVNNLNRRGRITIDLVDSFFTPHVISYSPDFGGNLGDVSVKFFVFGILDGTVITLKKGAKTITMNQNSQIYLNGGKEIYGTFNLLNADTGVYDIVLTLPNNNADKITISKGFRVIKGQNKDISLDIIGFSNIRINTPQTYMMAVTNNSLNNKYGVPIYIAVDSNATLNFSSGIFKVINKDSLSRLSKCDFVVSDSLFNQKFKCKIYCILLGKIKPLETSYFSFQLTALTNLQLLAWTTESPYISDNDKTYVTCLSDFSKKYLKVNPTVTCLSTNFQTPLISFINFAKLPKYEYSSENSSLSDIKCDYLNLLQKCSVCVSNDKNYSKNLIKSYFKQYSKTDCSNAFVVKNLITKNLRAVGSLDPNDKIGPDGINQGKFVIDNTDFTYNIRFENNPDSATAPANIVRIIDTLDLNVFDLESFRFKAMYFDKHFYEIPPKLDSFTTIVDLWPEKPLALKLTAKIDKKGIVTWEYVSLNSNNLLVNEDPLLGFLPPNKVSPEGEGGVLFSISLKKPLLTNRITNKAYIYFDNNKEIITPISRNIIDNTPPMSHVISLPPISPKVFQLNWIGIDTCSGVYNYDIYYAIGNKPFNQLLTKVDYKSFSFAGMEDSTYSFYSIARDSMGFIEIKSPKIEAQTKIEKKSIGIPTIHSGTIQISPNPSTDHVYIKIEANINPKLLLIKDLSGKVIKEIKITNHDFKVDIKELASGVYFMNFISDSVSISKKIIKI